MIGRLKEKGVLVDQDWLEQCVKYISQQHQPVFEGIWNQLLYSDLREFVIQSSLPVLSAAHLYTVNSPNMFQIMEITEVGFSTQHMMDYIHEIRTKNMEPSYPRKMLKVILTDGIQTIIGMEYKKIPFLSIVTPIGTKVQLTNATVRRGVLLLDSQNVTILGGVIANLNMLEPHLRIENLLKTKKTGNKKPIAQEPKNAKQDVPLNSGHDSNKSNDCLPNVPRENTEIFVDDFAIEDFEFDQAILDDIDKKMTCDNFAENNHVDHCPKRFKQNHISFEQISAQIPGSEFVVHGKWKGHTKLSINPHYGFWMTLDITDGASEAKLLLNDEYISIKIGISASEFKSKAANTNSKDELLNMVNCFYDFVKGIDGDIYAKSVENDIPYITNYIKSSLN